MTRIMVRMDVNAPSLIVRRPEAARLLGVSLPTVDRWARSGHLPPPRRIGPGVVGWPRPVLEEWIRTRPQIGGAAA